MSFRGAVRVGFGVLTIMTLGCASPPARQRESWPILRRYAADDSNIDRPMRVVARDWATYWQLGLPEIDIDWDEEMVLVAALGPTPRPDATVRVTDITWDGTTLVPRVELITDDGASNGADAEAPIRMRSPYDLIVVPANDENVLGFTLGPPPARDKRDKAGIPIPGLP